MFVLFADEVFGNLDRAYTIVGIGVSASARGIVFGHGGAADDDSRL